MHLPVLPSEMWTTLYIGWLWLLQLTMHSLCCRSRLLYFPVANISCVGLSVKRCHHQNAQQDCQTLTAHCSNAFQPATCKTLASRQCKHTPICCESVIVKMWFATVVIGPRRTVVSYNDYWWLYVIICPSYCNNIACQDIVFRANAAASGSIL